MRRLLVLNNYSLDALREEVKRGESPDHLLFGINHFEAAGWNIELLPFGEAGFWQQFNRFLATIRFPIPFGDLQQQREACTRLNDCDLIYAACQTQTQTLSYLRALGLIRRPIVCVAHHPLNRGKLGWLREPFVRWQLRGTDAFPSLSSSVAQQLNARVPGKSTALFWGVDQNFYKAAADPGEGVIACGRTGRDFVTFGLGATASGAPAKIVCLKCDVTPEFSRFGKNVSVDIQPDSGWVRYPQLVERFATARALAIPLYRQTSIAGLSSLNDALGMGKPVVMTRHPLVDLDIEKEGIGRWIDPGDVAGWRDAIQWFDDHPEESMAMGRRARELVDHGFNSKAFANGMLSIFEDVIRK